ncbi:MAG: TetR/AcrR family transcriptional regulator [Pseudomonadota bacterium]
MSNRQRIGLRKEAPPTTRAPGRKRRQQLLDATAALLSEKEIEDVSFRDIAKRAGVPEGSAYHFFANRFDIFSALACELNEVFIKAHKKTVPASKRAQPRQLIEYMVDVGARIYGKSAPARQIFVGGKTPPEVKQAERRNDRDVADAMFDSYVRYFDIADSDETRNAFGYFIEITDLMFTLSIVEHGTITPRMLDEAKRAGVAYLETYL